MAKNYNILSTSELKDEIKKLTEQFNKAKETLSENYKIMEETSNKYEEIQAIINKRGGKSND